MDRIIDKIAAFGVPGLVLLVATATSGVAGGAAIVAALAALGGPIGMVGGIGLLILLAMVAQALARYGIEALFRGVIDRIKRDQGLSNEEIEAIIDGYWFISEDLKRRLKEFIRRWGGGGGEPTDIPVRP